MRRVGKEEDKRRGRSEGVEKGNRGGQGNIWRKGKRGVELNVMLMQHDGCNRIGSAGSEPEGVYVVKPSGMYLSGIPSDGEMAVDL